MELGLSQEQLAAQAGVTAGAVGQWELGLTSPRLETIALLKEALGMSPEWLISGDSGTGRGHHGPSAAFDGSVALDRALVEEARQLGIKVRDALNDHLRVLVTEARSRSWLKENRDALADANAFLARYGLWSDGKRQF